MKKKETSSPLGARMTRSGDEATEIAELESDFVLWQGASQYGGMLQEPG
jgi:hypothetical protein